MDNGDLMKVLAKKPHIFEEDDKYWKSPDLMEMNLSIELDESNNLGSRGIKFATNSVNWLDKLLNENCTKKSVLDLGCGTGIITREFYKAGYEVIGVDISSKAIAYAKKNTEEINYINSDYFTLNINNTFDIIYLGYCTLGMYGPKKRFELLRKCYEYLNDGGVLVLDVFSQYKFANFCEYKIWDIDISDDMWTKSPYLHFLNFIIYKEDNTYLDRHIIYNENEIKCYNRWNHTFSIQELTDSLRNNGFAEIQIYNDICGGPYKKGGDTICAVAYKYLV
ncbi:class I SAM-dependent methyltransferase [Erysipelotrichaceae bacterium 66-17]